MFRIEADRARFREIVRGRIRQDLRKYLSTGELIGRAGDRSVSIPLPQIELPRFIFGENPKGSGGQGEGENGEASESDAAEGEGAGGAGEHEGKHILEVEVELEELAEMLGEELQLPNIEPRGVRELATDGGRYNGVRRAGPDSLRQFRRSFRNALKRSIAGGLYDPEQPRIVPIREDFRYRMRRSCPQPDSSAVVFHMMDVSGSMGREQKEIVRIKAFWIDTWLRSQYKNLEVVYIVHDAVARIVDQHTFFHLRESGGTKISSAYDLCLKQITERFRPDDWNIYPFHYSDGDNWSARDTELCISMLRDEILPRVNQFCYGQVKSAHGSGQFKKDLDNALSEQEFLVTSCVNDRGDVPEAIKAFLGGDADTVRLKSDLPTVLKYQAVIIESAARDAGLDFFEVVFELLDAQDVNGVAAYGGFPVRYPSWRFGMEYERLEKGRKWGLSKIYELVINNDPTYAYLVRSNSLLEQKLVMAHVYGHADFFKHNLWFAPTDRKMLDTMGNHSVRIRRYIDSFGLEAVERFVDLCLSIDTLVDPYLPLREYSNPPENRSVYSPPSERARRALDALTMTNAREPAEDVSLAPRVRELPTYDIVGFLEENAPLEAWQRDLLHIVRTEAYYFAPQRMTKIMNEGWASFWHSRLLTGGILDPSEILDFADCHSGATMSGPGQVNPYKIGIELFRHAEARGEDIFQLRRVHNDVSLVHKLVDEEFANTHLAPVFMPPQAMMPGPDPRTAEGWDWLTCKSRLLQQLAWGGLPQIELVEVDPGGDGELLLVHHHDGRDLQLARARETLVNLEAVWRRPVHLLTILDKQGRRIVVSEGEVSMLDTREAEEVCGGDRGLGLDPDALPA